MVDFALLLPLLLLLLRLLLLLLLVVVVKFYCFYCIGPHGQPLSLVSRRTQEKNELAMRKNFIPVYDVDLFIETAHSNTSRFFSWKNLFRNVQLNVPSLLNRLHSFPFALCFSFHPQLAREQVTFIWFA